MNDLLFLGKRKIFSIQSVFLCLGFLLASTVDAYADRTFNIQIESPLNTPDSLHSSVDLPLDLLNTGFEKDPEEIIAIEYQVFANNDQLIFKGSDKDWFDVKNPDLNKIKRSAEFFFFSENTNIYKIFSPTSYSEIKDSKKSKRKRRIRKIKNKSKDRKNKSKTRKKARKRKQRSN